MAIRTTSTFSGTASGSNLYVGVRPTGICKDPSFVKCTGSKYHPNIKTYEVLSEELPKDRCHFFFGVVGLSVETLVTKHLRCKVFKPTTTLGKEFQLDYVVFDGVPFYWCSFPKSYRGTDYHETCKSIAQTYDLVIKRTPHNLTIIWGKDADDFYAAELADTCKKKTPTIKESKMKEKPVSKAPEKDLHGFILRLPASDQILNMECVGGEPLSQEVLKKIEGSIV